MLREIRELGFEYAELSHGIRISLLPGIFDAVDSGEIKISTLHNFCPLPMGVTHAAPNIYQFTSLDARERESAVRHTLKTLETAARVQAGLVVLHMGSVEMKDYTEKLVEMIGKGQKETPKYEKIFAEAIEKREQKKDRHMAGAYEALRRVVARAEELGLRLGIENREAIEEIPFESDFDAFFREFASPAVGYWHDTGHAQIKENLGLIHHQLHLESFSSRLFGFHVHDVEFPGRDHRSPGSGMVDFGALTPVVKPGQIKVFEFSPSLKIEQVQSGIIHIKSIWGPE